MAAQMGSNIHPEGGRAGSGFDYVYSPNQVVGALQTSLLMDQRKAMQDAANEYRREQLRQRAKDAELKSLSVPAGDAGWYSDYDSQSRNILTSSLIDAHAKGTYNPAWANLTKGQYLQQQKAYQAATQQHEKFLQQTKSQSPYIDEGALRSVMHENRIAITDPIYKSRNGLSNYGVPVNEIHESSLDNPRIYQPAAMGAYVVKSLSGKNTYQMQNPNGTGETITRDKMFDKTGKLNADIAKDLLLNNPSLNRGYNALYKKNLEAAQGLGLIQGLGTPMEQKRIADQTVREIFPDMLGDFTRKIDNTPTKASSAGSKSALKNLGIEQGEVSDRVHYQLYDQSKPLGYDRNDARDFVEETRPVTALYEAKKNALAEIRIPSGTKYRSIGNPVGADGKPLTGHSIFGGDVVVSSPGLTSIPYTTEAVTLRSGIHFRRGQQIPKEFVGDPALKDKLDTRVGFEVVPLESQEITNASKTFDLDSKGNPIPGSGRATTSGNDKEGTPRVNKLGKTFIELGDAPVSLTTLFRQKLKEQGVDYDREVQKYRNLYRQSGGQKVKTSDVLGGLNIR